MAAVSEQRVREIIAETLKQPVDFPRELKAWVVSYVESSGMQLPRSDVTGLYTTASSVTSLGEAVHGRPATVRAGASPYEFMQMTYDQVYGKWVSSQVWFVPQLTASWSSNPTTYTAAAATDMARIIIPNFLDLYTAGLRPQVFVSALLDNGSIGGISYLRAALYQFNSGDTTVTVMGTGGEITHNTTTATYKTSTGWQAITFSPTPTEQHAFMIAEYKSDDAAHTAIFSQASIALRWVSA